MQMGMIDSIIQGAHSMAQGIVNYNQSKWTRNIKYAEAAEMDMYADDLLRQGYSKQDATLASLRQTIGGMDAQAASSGFEGSSQVYLDIKRQTALNGLLDADQIRQNAQNEAFSMRNLASITRLQGKMARRAGNFGNLISAGSALGQGFGSYNSAYAGKGTTS